ncbi:ABC transporter substrate-binding protein [Massiliimalia timonensis]|uniref:ABC transporter substrate-binding protein n=1 Tax=Massiliimalia timonensis TaxID=1987501 RepID=UPI00189D2616|nr:extracellular solute-binding protein [Massiliimalia timonensis]
MKKILAGSLTAVLLVGLLAGCGKTDNETSGNANTGDAGKATTITHWEMVNGPADTYEAAAKKIVENFNSSNDQNITVELQMTPWDNFYQTFLTAITSGAAPDTSTGASTQPLQYALMGEILDLQPIVDQWNEEGNDIVNQFPEGSLDMLTYDGELTGLPWALDPRGLTYRTDYFEQAGITELPTTWEEFLDVCKKLKEWNSDIVPFVFGGADQMSTQTMMMFLMQNGTGFTNENVEADFTSKNVTEALEFLHELASNGYISEGTASYKSADAEKMYCSGTAAIWFNGMPTATIDYEDVAANSSVLPARADLQTDKFFSDTWYTKEFSEKVVPVAVPQSWPAPALFPAFSQIEGEDYPGKALQAVITGDTDYEKIQKETNDLIATAIEDYGADYDEE